MSKLLFGGLVSAISSVFSCTPEPKGSPLIVQVAAHGTDCQVTVGHERVNSQRLSQIALAGTHSWGIVEMERDAPYKCVGAAIITLQQAGFTTVRTEELPNQ